MKPPKQVEWTVNGLENVIVSADADMSGDDLRAALRVDGCVLAGIEFPLPKGSPSKRRAPGLAYVHGGVLVVQPRYHVQLPTSMAGSDLEIGAKLLRIISSKWSERTVSQQLG